MRLPLQITYRGLEPSEFIDQNVEKRVERLEHFYPNITSCHVTIELPHQHHQRGNRYRVQVDVAVPGASVVSTQGAEDPAHEDAYVAIRDAFNAATRQLEDRIRRIRGEHRPHAVELPEAGS